VFRALDPPSADILASFPDSPRQGTVFIQYQNPIFRQIQEEGIMVRKIRLRLLKGHEQDIYRNIREQSLDFDSLARAPVALRGNSSGDHEQIQIGGSGRPSRRR
jgi:hypothetical protein